MIVFLFFTFYLIFSFYKKKFTWILSFLIVSSSGLGLLFYKDLYIYNSIQDFLVEFYVLIILLLLVTAWSKFKIRTGDLPEPSQKVFIFFNIINYIGFLTAVVLAITVLTVVSKITDINDYKYGSGNEGFLDNNLPVDIRLYMITNLTYMVSYFNIPLFFYFFIKGYRRKALLSLILSFNIILYGFTFFSRWTLTHYILIFIVFLWIFKSDLPQVYLKQIKRVFIVLGISYFYFFNSITSDRFSEDELELSSETSDLLEIEDLETLSTLDYFSQWLPNSRYVLGNYEGETLLGQNSFSSLLVYLDRFTPISWSQEEFIENKRRIIGYDYYYRFNGIVASLVYDFGYFFTFLFSIIYFIVVRKHFNRYGIQSFVDLLLLVILVQIPLFAIFYNFTTGLVWPFIFWIFIKIYFRIKI